MKKSTLAIVSVAAVALLVGVGLKLSNSSSGDVSRVMAEIEKEQSVYKPLMTGCVTAALTNPQTAMLILATGGKVCLQVIQNDAKKVLEGSGICDKNNDKCLFTLGYVKTAAAMGSLPKTKEEISALQDEIDSSYEKAQPLEE